MYLPRDSSKGEKEHVVCVRPVRAGRDGADPVLAVDGDGLHGLIDPGERDTDDQADENTSCAKGLYCQSAYE